MDKERRGGGEGGSESLEDVVDDGADATDSMGEEYPDSRSYSPLLSFTLLPAAVGGSVVRRV